MVFNQRVVNEAAFKLAQRVLGIVQCPEEDKRALFEAVYQAAKIEIESYETAVDRMQQRLKGINREFQPPARTELDRS